MISIIVSVIHYRKAQRQWTRFGIRVNAGICNFLVLNERRWCHIEQRSNSGKRTASWVTSCDAAISSQSGADSCRAGRRREELQGRGALPLRNQPIGSQVTFHRDTPSRSHSLVLFRTEGVESVKVLMGWRGQLDCTGVGTAELGLISMAL